MATSEIKNTSSTSTLRDASSDSMSKDSMSSSKPAMGAESLRSTAERFASDHTGLRDDEDFWDRASEQLDAELLTDLALSCAMWLGMGRMLRTLDIGQTCRITL